MLKIVNKVKSLLGLKVHNYYIIIDGPAPLNFGTSLNNKLNGKYDRFMVQLSERTTHISIFTKKSVKEVSGFISQLVDPYYGNMYRDYLIFVNVTNGCKVELLYSVSELHKIGVDYSIPYDNLEIVKQIDLYTQKLDNIHKMVEAFIIKTSDQEEEEVIVEKVDKQEIINSLLDKINQHGAASLTDEEIKTMEKYSNDLNK